MPLDGSSIVDDHEYFTQNVIADVDNEYHVFTDAKSRINVWLAIHIVSEIGKRGNHHLKFATTIITLGFLSNYMSTELTTLRLGM